MTIRPVSDLRNNFKQIEEDLKTENPIFLTKNGYGSMVLMSLEHYDAIKNQIDSALTEAEQQAEDTSSRMSHEEVFETLRKKTRKK